MTDPAIPDANSVDLSTRLAFERTRVSFERTMLSWIRTGTSLITFGFGVYKFFQIEQKPAARDYLIGYQEFGIILVSIGLVALTMGTMEYQRNLRGLGPGYAGRASWRPMLFAGSIAVLGVLAFIVMLLRQ
jgi:putative membrane protein